MSRSRLVKSVIAGATVAKKPRLPGQTLNAANGWMFIIPKHK